MSEPLSGQPPEPFAKNKGSKILAWQRTCCPKLSTDTECLDDDAIAFHIFLLQVIKKATPLPDDLQQTTPGMMILLVRPKVFGEVGDAIGQQRDLYFRRTGIDLMGLEFIYDFLFTFCGQHCAISFPAVAPGLLPTLS
jgi:hypothetical protein